MSYIEGRPIKRSRRITNQLARYVRFALGEVVELLSLRLVVKANTVGATLKIDTSQLRWGLDHVDGMLRQLDRQQGKVNLDTREAAENSSALDLVANGIFNETVKPRVDQFFKKLIPKLSKELTKAVEEKLNEVTKGKETDDGDPNQPETETTSCVPKSLRGKCSLTSIMSFVSEAGLGKLMNGVKVELLGFGKVVLTQVMQSV